jgi:hypothetical protein
MSHRIVTLIFGDSPVEIEKGQPTRVSRTVPDGTIVFPEMGDSDKRPMQMQGGRPVRVGRKLPKEGMR